MWGLLRANSISTRMSLKYQYLDILEYPDKFKFFILMFGTKDNDLEYKSCVWGFFFLSLSSNTVFQNLFYNNASYKSYFAFMMTEGGGYGNWEMFEVNVNFF